MIGYMAIILENYLCIIVKYLFSYSVYKVDTCANKTEREPLTGYSGYQV